MKALLLGVLIAFAAPAALAQDAEPPVKKSRQGICHEKGYGSYRQTRHFTPYDSMEACEKSGGRAAQNVTWKAKWRKPLQIATFVLVGVGLLWMGLRGPYQRWRGRRREA